MKKFNVNVRVGTNKSEVQVSAQYSTQAKKIAQKLYPVARVIKANKV